MASQNSVLTRRIREAKNAMTIAFVSVSHSIYNPLRDAEVLCEVIRTYSGSLLGAQTIATLSGNMT